MKTHFVILICIIPIVLSARTFRINNQCSQKIWLGIDGNPLIYSGGLEIGARSTRDISVPDNWVRKHIMS